VKLTEGLGLTEVVLDTDWRSEEQRLDNELRGSFGAGRRF
jgi:hypothetical protein